MAPCWRSPTPPLPSLVPAPSIYSYFISPLGPYISTSSLCSHSGQNHSFPLCLFAPLQIFFASQSLLPNPLLSLSRLFYDSPYNPIFSLFSSYLSLCSTEIPVIHLLFFSATPFLSPLSFHLDLLFVLPLL